MMTVNNDDILLIGPLGTNCSEILIEIFIQENAFEKVVWRMPAILSWPQCVNALFLFNCFMVRSSLMLVIYPMCPYTGARHWSNSSKAILKDMSVMGLTEPQQTITKPKAEFKTCSVLYTASLVVDGRVQASMGIVQQTFAIVGNHAPGMPGTFSTPLWVSYLDMHHGTCVTHVPWCMPGSLSSGFLWSRWRESVPAFPAHA